MSSKKKTETKKKTEKAVKPMPAIDLKIIVDAGPNGMYVPAEIAEPLQDAGFVEINLDIKNDKGEVACRATDAGIAEVGAAPAPITESVSAPSNSDFKIDAGIPVPAPVGRGRSGSKYPFDALKIGQSFFVPDTAEQPDAAASLASTVSGATQRYAADHPTETREVKGKTVPKKIYSRKFALRKIAAGAPGCGPNGEAGARVWRVEVGAAE